jgi:hypothetical protein
MGKLCLLTCGSSFCPISRPLYFMVCLELGTLGHSSGWAFLQWKYHWRKGIRHDQTHQLPSIDKVLVYISLITSYKIPFDCHNCWL